MTCSAIAERLRDDRENIRAYCASITRWNIMSSVEKPLKQLDLLADFLAADADFLKLQVNEVSKVFRDSNEFTPGIMTQHLLSLRGDVCAEDRKLWLAPYAAELKAIDDAKKAAAHAAATHKLVHMLSNKPHVPSTPSTPSAAGIGSTPYGLEIVLLRGTDLAIKDTTTSDPYVNILLLASNGARLEKRGSKTIEKNLNPMSVGHTFHGPLI
jgi:hypothetical protein